MKGAEVWAGDAFEERDCCDWALRAAPPEGRGRCHALLSSISILCLIVFCIYPYSWHTVVLLLLTFFFSVFPKGVWRR